MEESGQEQSEQLIEHLTQQISQWGLALPAIVFLQVTRPLSFLASQGLLLCQPLLSFVYDVPRIADYADLLADRTNIDRLVARLEEGNHIDGTRGKEKDG
ncbi:MAG: hypothetical protein P8189_11735 [Anaerolineae bacterium]|jgi:hypothetical protein